MADETPISHEIADPTPSAETADYEKNPETDQSVQSLDPADAVPVESEQDSGNAALEHVEPAAASGIKSESTEVPLAESNDVNQTAEAQPAGSPIKARNGTYELPETADGRCDVAVSTGEPKPLAVEPMIQPHQEETPAPNDTSNLYLKDLFLMDEDDDGSDSGSEEEQGAFLKELQNFFRERSMEFRPPKFYGIVVNCLKLWRAVVRLGGYDKVTSCKLWRNVGETFNPPKTCTTVSWTFRGFYEKALLDYERHKLHSGESILPGRSDLEAMHDSKSPGSGRARRDAATRAMEGWHSRLHGNGEVTDPITKDKNAISAQKRDRPMKSIGLPKRKAPYMETNIKAARTKSPRTQIYVSILDIGPAADWVKINVKRAKDCFEIYALVPGLLREEIRVQSDPAGRVFISGEPEHPDNPWGVTSFKKVVNLPSRVDPHQTSAVVTLHGQLFVRVPFDQTDQ